MADGTSSLASLAWGTSTGGAAGSAETTLTLGVDRVDTRTPPDNTRVWGLQINQVKNLALAMSATFKGGTRLGLLTQTANPFGVNESGFYMDTSGAPWSVFNGTPTALGGGSAALGNWTFGGNNADLSGAGTMGLALATATALSVGNSSFTNLSLTASRFNMTQRALSSATQTQAFLVTGGAHTALTASTELVDFNVNLARTVQFSTGNIVTQRASVIQAPTYSAVGASNFTGNTATLAVTGAPTMGTNATNTGNLWALWLQAGNLGMGANSTIGQSAQAATNTTALTLAPNVADGASSVALTINATTALSNATARLLSLQNAGSEKIWIDKDGTINLTKLTFIGGGTSIVLGGAVNQSIGGFRPDSDNARDLGSSGTQWSQTFCGFYGTRSPTTLSSGTTITPTQMYHKVSGSTSVSTIATGSLPSGFIGWIALTCTGAVPFATGGNILTSFTATTNKTYVFWFDGTNWSVQAAG